LSGPGLAWLRVFGHRGRCRPRSAWLRKPS